MSRRALAALVILALAACGDRTTDEPAAESVDAVAKPAAPDGTTPEERSNTARLNAEQALEIANTLIASNSIDVLVVDSVAALVPSVSGRLGKSAPRLARSRLASSAPISRMKILRQRISLPWVWS